MRIAYLSYSVLPSQNANAVQVMRMADAFSAAGHEVVVAARRGLNHGIDLARFYGLSHDFEVVSHSRPSFPVAGKFLYARSIAQSLESLGPFDLAYGRHAPTAYLTHGRVPSIHEVHAPATLLSRRLEDRLVQSPHGPRFVFISEGLAHQYRRRYPGLSDARSMVLPNGAAPMSSSTEPMRLRGRRDSVKVGYAGSLHPGKGMDMVAALAESMPEFEFHVAGGPARETKRWRRRVGHLRNLHLYGAIEPSRVPAFLLGCDVLVAPFRSEFTIGGRTYDAARTLSSLKIPEYMAAGRAIVCSDFGSIRAVVDPGVTALVAPSGDVAQWRSTLVRLRSAPERARLAAAAKAAFEKSYSYAARVDRVLEWVSR